MMNASGEMRVSSVLRRDLAPLSWRMTVGEALASLRARPLGERIVYFYVVDDDGRLRGVVPTRRLLMASPDTRIANVMVADVVALPAAATLRDAARLFLEHKLLALPVVDADGRLDGVVDIAVFTGEISNVAARQSANDAFEFIGARVAAQTGAWRGFVDRFPWLLCNVGGGMAAALIAASYEPMLQAIIALALFIPVALTVSESVAMQSVTLTLQHLHAGPADARFLVKALRRELATATLLGAGCGAIVGAIAWVWKRDAAVAFSVAATITAAMAAAALLGVILPGTLRAMRRNPRIAAGPIVLALTDVLTLFCYFTIARAVL
jgi:magnesium transporter